MALLPEGPTGFSTATIQPHDTYMSIELNDNTTQTVSVKDPVWDITVGYPDLTVEQGEDIIVFLYSLGGKQTKFEVRLPQYLQPKNGLLAQGSATIAQSQVGNQIVISNSNGLVGADPSPGDMVQLGSSSKVYKILAVDNTVINETTLTVYPNLIVPTGASETIKFNNIEFSVRLRDEKVPAMALGLDGTYKGFTLELREDLG